MARPPLRQQGDRKQLILRCCFAGIVLSLLFAWNRQYWLLVSLGVLLASLTATASPQLFALAREYADSRNKQADMFSSVLRAQFSPGLGDRAAHRLRARHRLRL